MTFSSLFGLKESQLSQITNVLKQWPKIKNAIIFGSRAMGTFREGSDIDIALDAPGKSHDEYLRLSTQLNDLLLPHKIDLILLHQINNQALLNHIQRVGQQVL